MEDRTFDRLTVSVARTGSRRSVAKALLGGAGGALLALAGAGRAGAKPCKGTGKACAKDSQCCSGLCAPAPGKTAVGHSDAVCCAPGQVADATTGACCTPTTCAAAGKDCDTIDDGCGGSLDCGNCDSNQCLTCSWGTCISTCVTGQTCTGGACVCTDDNPVTCSVGCKGDRYPSTEGCLLCAAETPLCPGYECSGSAECVAALGPEWFCAPNGTGCGTPGKTGVCAHHCPASCTPTTCAAAGKDCGTIDDGCGGSLDCGTCTPPETCSGGGTSNVCGCTPTTCAAAGKDCGTIDDGCGGMLDCGSCDSNQCLTCSGGTCISTCVTGQTCISGACVCTDDDDGPCMNGSCHGQTIPSTEGCELCAAENPSCPGYECSGSAECVAAFGPDWFCAANGVGCNTPGKTGVCTHHCPASGGCTPTTCAAEGKDCGTIDDGCGGSLDCGSCVTGQTCSDDACVCANDDETLCVEQCTGEFYSTTEGCSVCADTLTGPVCGGTPQETSPTCVTSTDCPPGGFCWPISQGSCSSVPTATGLCGYRCAALG